jgi:hypothetical protein
MNKLKAPLLLALSMLAACGESLTTEETSIDKPIVESYLQEGDNALTVKVYCMEIYLKDGYELSQPLGGLSLSINGNSLTEAAEGAYTLDLVEDTIRGMEHYALSFDYRGRRVAAETTVPLPVEGLSVEPAYITRDASSFYWDVADTTQIRLAWDDPDGSYYQVYIESPASSDLPSMGGGEMQFRRRMMQPVRGNSYSAASREFMAAGDYWIHVYRVNKDYVNLYERVSATDLSNPASAIENGFGIFTGMSGGKIRFRVIEMEE